MKLRPAPFVRDLDTPLLKLSVHDAFTLRHACEGVHVFGATGSGKSSGSGNALIEAYLRAGMGGVWMCVKPEEVDHAITLAKAQGRGDSVILFDESQGCNFIEWELARHGLAGVNNVIECLMRILEAADAASGTRRASSDEFWSLAIRQVLNHTVPLLYCAHGTVTVPAILDFVTSAATHSKQYTDDEWCRGSYAARTMYKAGAAPIVPIDREGQEVLLSYWFNQYTAIPEKTRGNIVISLTTKLERFKHGRMQRAFCGQTTVVPEMTFHGAVIILAMPVLTWNEDGLIAQSLFKYLWQRAVESRNGLATEHRERPVFLFADEGHYFLDPKDDLFLSTCRASRACVVFLSQTLPSYYARLGKENSDAVDGLIGKFGTQVFHLNACSRTNSYASQLIGRGLVERATRSRTEGTNFSFGMNQGGSSNRNWGSSSGSSSGAQHSSNTGRNHGEGYGSSWGQNVGNGSNESWTHGSSEQMDWLVEPNFFATGLKNGGRTHGALVSAVWFKAGGNFTAAGGRHYMLTSFKQ